jgi:hypothetical protein
MPGADQMTVHGKFLICRDADGPIFQPMHGVIHEDVICWQRSSVIDSLRATTYGIVLEGNSELELCKSRHHLTQGCYFSAVGSFEISGGRGMLIRVPEYAGLNTIGGPVEYSGRLKYIDGCTDTLLISSPKFGDPCLNALYFPSQINQTAHTHPSVRLGAVLWGRGLCKTNAGTFALEAGASFCIPAGLLHSFHTEAEELAVVAYHPDSDFGPQDGDHPMVNRTMVDGVSAKQISAIRTL